MLTSPDMNNPHPKKILQSGNHAVCVETGSRLVRRMRIRRALLIVAAILSVTWAGSAAAGKGAEIYNELLEKGVIYPDERWQNYVTEIGERLLAESSDAGKTYTFVVVDQPMVNAWATADAYIFVTRGILAFFQSEDELAAVLGHEIGHVIGNHVGKSVTGNRLGKLAGILGTFATGSSSSYGLASAVTKTALASYGREHELEADEIGTDLILRAGYNPRALLDSIQMLRDHDNFQKTVLNTPTIYHGILGSHPAHNKRLNELVNQSQALVPAELAEPERDFYAMVDGLAYGDESSTGVVKDGVYYHGALRLRVAFPEGWDVQASSSEVYSIERTASGKAGPGKMSVRRSASPTETQTPEQYLTKTLRRDDLKDGAEIRVGPYPGYIATIETVAGSATELRQIAVVYKDGGVFLFNGELKQGGDAGIFAQAFLDAVMSFRAMTADDLRLVNNQKIKIIEARPGDTYAELARFVPVKSNAEAVLRVINGHHPYGEPRAGDRIKVIE